MVIFGLVGYPIGRTLWLSLREADLSFLVRGQSRFVGLDNYVTVFTDSHLRSVLLTTAVFGLSCVSATMTLGFAVAIFLNRRFRGRALLMVLVLLPWAMPRVAAGIVWRWLFHDQYGLVNWLLSRLGAVGFEGFAWFNDRLSAFVAIGVVVVWQSFPFVALSLLAGLRSIPPELLEAARADGASGSQRLRHVIVPLLRPLLVTLVAVSTIWDFKVFDQVYAMTQGGPARSTEVIAIAVYREAFTRFDLGVAAALATSLFAVLAVLAWMYVRLGSGPTGARTAL